MALFIVYGSLVPFVYRPATLGQAIELFAHIPWLDIDEEGRADWVANLVLYLPFGFLASGALSKKSTAVAMAVTAILGTILATGVEFLQIWADPRTVSLNDIVAEVAGTLIGIIFWAAFGRRLVRAAQSVLLGGPQALRAAIVLYLLAYFFNSLFPFDFFVSAAEVHARLADPTAFAWLSRGLFSLRGVISLFLKAVLMMPLGAAIAFVWRRGALAAAICALLLSGFLEVTHLFEISARADAASIFAAMLGAVAGNLLARSPVRIDLVPIGWVRRVAFAAAPFYLLLLPMLRGWKRGHVSRDFIAQTIASMHWLPFYYHYYTSEGHALASVVSISASMVPLGALAWAARLRSGEPAGQTHSYVPVALAAFFLSAILEIGGLVTAGNRPDPTNVLVAVAAAAISQRTFEWLARVLSEISLPVAT
jgi:glycopeptide antibiotics resistance protein